MAHSDPTPAPVLTREQRLAATVVERFNLVPPVNVLALARHFADLEFDFIPGGCDGLVLGLHGPRPRPLILVDASSSELRQRFTTAHEIGHVLLPWHVASSFLCNTDRASYASDEAFHAANAETEANGFAANLLVPAGWLRQTIEEVGLRPASLTEAIQETRVSAHVACIRLARELPAGQLFAVLGPLGEVVLSGQSRGTGIQPLPPRGMRLERRRLDRFAAAVEEVRYGPWRVVWWTFRGEALDHTPSQGDSRTSREIEDGLLARHAPGASEAQALRNCLSGVIGAAFGDARRENDTTAAAVYTRLRGRFAKQRDRIPDSLLDDPDFEPWLRRRAADLAMRVAASTGS